MSNGIMWTTECGFIMKDTELESLLYDLINSFKRYRASYKKEKEIDAMLSERWKYQPDYLVETILYFNGINIKRNQNGVYDTIEFPEVEYHALQQHLLDLIAKHAKAGSYIEMEGNDGSTWRWEFENMKAVMKPSVRVKEEVSIITPTPEEVCEAAKDVFEYLYSAKSVSSNFGLPASKVRDARGAVLECISKETGKFPNEANRISAKQRNGNYNFRMLESLLLKYGNIIITSDNEKEGFNDILIAEGNQPVLQEKLLMAIAPFVEENSFIDMKDEEGNAWRWEFEDGECIKDENALIFDEDYVGFFGKIKRWFNSLFKE